MKLNLIIDLDNAIFDVAAAVEPARILRQLADRIEAGGRMDGSLLDRNGNVVGKSWVSKDRQPLPRRF